MKQVLLLFLLTSTLRAAPVNLTNPAQAYDLFRASSLLEVKPGQVTIGSLLQSPGSYSFVPTRNDLIHPNNRQRAYWFRVEVNNQTAEEFFLHFVYSGTERISVYELADNKVIGQRELGRLVAEQQDYFRYSKLFYPMQMRQGGMASGQTHTFYIYMEGIYTTCLYVNARSAIKLIEVIHYEDLFYGLYYGFILIIVVYGLLLFIRLRDHDTFRYAMWVLSMGLQLGLYRGFTTEFLWPINHAFELYGSALAGFTGLLHVLFTISFLRLRRYQPIYYRLGWVVIAAYSLGITLFVITAYRGGTTGRTIDIIPAIALVEGVFSLAAGGVAYRHGFKPALYYLLGNLIFFVSIFVFIQYAGGQLPHTFWTYNSIHIGSGIEIVFFTFGLVYKVNMLKQRKEEAVREQLRLAQANERLVEEQNSQLEAKVRQRTDELNIQKNQLQSTLTTLQTTQEQLIQKEKMASLGELMAGIAHEIQNPLNFVNNFAEVSAEMLDELKDEIEADHKTDALALADELVPNLQKINHHGKRAEAIVRDMLQHSRSSAEAHQPTDLNALADECLQLAYQGFRAKDKTINAQFHTDFDPEVRCVDLMPQEFSRVLLNLYNNALYATHQKEIRLTTQLVTDPIPIYKSQIWVSTCLENGQVVLRVKDNGTGIPAELVNKIYQPFFTTKPPGQGTGLGLSLSYDIITKRHGGQLEVQTEQGVYTEFAITLPLKWGRESLQDMEEIADARPNRGAGRKGEGRLGEYH